MHYVLADMTTRREFLTDAARLALGLGALNTGIRPFAFVDCRKPLEEQNIAHGALTASDISLGNELINTV